jgi:DNA-binding SARP family transcriptional activator
VERRSGAASKGGGSSLDVPRKSRGRRADASGRADLERDGERAEILYAQILGPIQVTFVGGRLGPRDFGGVKPKQVLEILLLARGRAVSKDVMADHLWGESLPRNVSASLETYVSVLRRRLDPSGQLGHGLIQTERAAYRIPSERVDLDLDRFDDLVREAAVAVAAEGKQRLELAMELVRGEVLEDEIYAEWADPLRQSFRRRCVRALLDASGLALRLGDAESGLSHSEEALSWDPLSEHAYRLMMLAWYCLGRQAEALRAFGRCHSMLAAEFEVEPLDETRTLDAAIRRHEDPRKLMESIEVGSPAQIAMSASGSELTRAG